MNDDNEEDSSNLEFSYFNESSHFDMDDKELINKIAEKYPNLLKKLPDSDLRKEFLAFISDQMFVYELMDHQGIDIKTLLKSSGKYFGQIFNSVKFIRKVQGIIDLYKYDD